MLSQPESVVAQLLARDLRSVPAHTAWGGSLRAARTAIADLLDLPAPNHTLLREAAPEGPPVGRASTRLSRAGVPTSGPSAPMGGYEDFLEVHLPDQLGDLALARNPSLQTTLSRARRA